ncbi:MAG: hypothetical protein R3242_03090 [Akkermansiaceae bacterium]|nr:hypothetical protein [Akkermansiaceae bacterium]
MKFRHNGLTSLVFIAAAAGYVTYLGMRNGDSKVAYVAGGIAAGIVIATASYYLLRSLKGRLKLELDQKSVASGEAITGKLHIRTKKSVHADRLYIALIGQQQCTGQTRSTGSNAHWEEFYRDELDVMVEQKLHAGYRQTVDFELHAPFEGQIHGDAHVEGMDPEEVKARVETLRSIAKALGGRKRWRMIARLETKGVDLANSQKLHVSLKSV